jgi:aminoglycoside phosphotransferase (APT) family kinase protein
LILTHGPQPHISLREARQMAATIITHHMGRPPSRVVHKAAGKSNFVFLVKHPDGEFVVRLSPKPARINSYMKEQWAMSRAHAVGVPTAEVLEVGNEVVPCPYMISRQVKGQVASRRVERLEILREMGRYAALVNSIETTGFGGTFDWSSNRLSRNETWKEFLCKDLRLEERLDILCGSHMLSAKQAARVREALQGAEDPPARPTLNHGDLRLKNVILDERGSITALIDWEHCLSSLAPAWDLSIALHDLSIDEKHAFLAGYGLRREELARVAPLMKALNIINYAPKVERLLEANETERLEECRTRFTGALDMYSL